MIPNNNIIRRSQLIQLHPCSTVAAAPLLQLQCSSSILAASVSCCDVRKRKGDILQHTVLLRLATRMG